MTMIFYYRNPYTWKTVFLLKCFPEFSPDIVAFHSQLMSFELKPWPHRPSCKYFAFWLRWRHNGCDGVSNHQPHNCLLNRLFRRRSKKTSKLRVTGLCVGISPGADEFPVQMASNAKNVSIWWRHHVEIFFRHRKSHDRCPPSPEPMPTDGQLLGAPKLELRCGAQLKIAEKGLFPHSTIRTRRQISQKLCGNVQDRICHSFWRK